MKKIFAVILSLLFIVTLVACEEITDDYNKEQKPSITLSNTGDLIQIYNENTLENVTFTVTLKKFEENEVKDVEINWYVRGQLFLEHKNKKTITQAVTIPGEIPIKVVVTFKFEGKTQTLEENALINVVKTPTKILVTNSIDTTTHLINVKMGDNTEVTFNGTVTGNLNHEVVKWVIQRQTSNEPVVIDEIPVTNLVEKEGVVKLTYNFTAVGNYIVTLQTGEGTGQDANKHISNSTHINVNFGVFEISTNDNKVMSTPNISSRTLIVNELNPAVVGDGTYEWYLDGEKLLGKEGLELVHDNNNLGGFLYQVKFVPSITNTLTEEVETDPFLVVNGIQVSDEAELLDAIENKEKGIIITDDIKLTTNNMVIIDFETAIYGNGKTLEGTEIETFVKVTHDNVKISNMTIENAQKYVLHLEKVLDAYLEDIKMKDFGNTDLNAMLSGDFNAGIFVDRSEAIINNVEFITGGLVGIRLDQQLNNPGKTVLKLYGEFKYDEAKPVILPIGSGKSDLSGVELIAAGFDYFALPAGDITIRRWDNQGDPISWEIYDPEKTTYASGEYLDLFGIGINVDISFIGGIEFAAGEGLAFVKLYIEFFSQYGIVEITDMNDVTQGDKYYIVGSLGDTDSQVFGKDKLIYSLDKTISTTNSPVNSVRPTLPTTTGDYKIKISIGEEFYLGHIIIKVE